MIIVVGEERIRKAGKAAQELLETAERQLGEHKQWLKKIFRDWLRHHATDSAFVAAFDSVSDIRLAAVIPEEKRDAEGRTTVSITYEYPDVLYDFLRSEACPAAMKETLVGGAVVE